MAKNPNIRQAADRWTRSIRMAPRLHPFSLTDPHNPSEDVSAKNTEKAHPYDPGSTGQNLARVGCIRAGMDGPPEGAWHRATPGQRDMLEIHIREALEADRQAASSEWLEAATEAYWRVIQADNPLLKWMNSEEGKAAFRNEVAKHNAKPPIYTVPPKEPLGFDVKVMAPELPVISHEGGWGGEGSTKVCKGAVLHLTRHEAGWVYFHFLGEPGIGGRFWKSDMAKVRRMDSVGEDSLPPEIWAKIKPRSD